MDYTGHSNGRPLEDRCRGSADAVVAAVTASQQQAGLQPHQAAGNVPAAPSSWPAARQMYAERSRASGAPQQELEYPASWPCHVDAVENTVGTTGRYVVDARAWAVLLKEEAQRLAGECWMPQTHLCRTREHHGPWLTSALGCDGVAGGDGVGGLGAERCWKVVRRSRPTHSTICRRFPRLRGS